MNEHTKTVLTHASYNYFAPNHRFNVSQINDTYIAAASAKETEDDNHCLTPNHLLNASSALWDVER